MRTPWSRLIDRSSRATAAAVGLSNIDAGARSLQTCNVDHAAAAEPARGVGGSKPTDHVIQLAVALRNSQTREPPRQPLKLLLNAPSAM